MKAVVTFMTGEVTPYIKKNQVIRIEFNSNQLKIKRYDGINFILYGHIHAFIENTLTFIGWYQDNQIGITFKLVGD